MLTSSLFRTDQRLIACQKSHQAHVTPGATGEHVRKIQLALYVLDNLQVDPEEIRLRSYGSSTANAVLRYKERRAIINRSYQSKPDNIVGIMTITALDQELAAWQLRNKKSGSCSAGGMRLGPRARLAFAGAARKSQDNDRIQAGAKKKHPYFGSSLLIKPYITETAAIRDGYDFRLQINAANEILSEYGMSILWPASRSPEAIKYAQTIIMNEDVALLRAHVALVEKMKPVADNYIRVIVCQRGVYGDPGETMRNVSAGDSVFRPFILLNTSAKSDNTVLLHEMIHASQPNPIPFDHDDEPQSVFFRTVATKYESTPHTWLKPNRAEELARGFFALPKLGG